MGPVEAREASLQVAVVEEVRRLLLPGSLPGVVELVRVAVRKSPGQACLQRVVPILAAVAEEIDALRPTKRPTIATDSRRELAGEEWATLVARKSTEAFERRIVDVDGGTVSDKRMRGWPSADFKSAASASFATPALPRTQSARSVRAG